MQSNELKGRIIAVYGKQYRFAQAIETTETKVSRTISGINKLDPLEARSWERALKLEKGSLKQLEAA